MVIKFVINFDKHFQHDIHHYTYNFLSSIPSLIPVSNIFINVQTINGSANSLFGTIRLCSESLEPHILVEVVQTTKNINY